MSAQGAKAETMSETGAMTRCSAAVLPDGAHAHRVLADRNGDAERRAQFHADRLDGGVEVGAVAGDGGRGHPVGGEVDLAEVADLARRRDW